jgi:serine protease
MKLSFLSLPYAIYLASKFVSTTGNTDANFVSTTGKTDANFVSTAGTNDGFLSLNNLDPKYEYIVDFEDGEDEAGFALLSQKSSSGDLVVKAEFNLFGEALIETTATVAADILINENIKAVELNNLDLNTLGWKDDDQIVKTKLRSGERRLNEETPYGIPMVQADQPFPQLPPSDYLKVCVVDTGYDNTHEDLPLLADNAGFDQYGDEWDVDGNGHGTHCAGTIGAIGLNSKGVTSVLNANTNSFTNFYIGKGLSDSGSGNRASAIAAMQECANAGAKVISMSLGGEEFSQSFDDACKTLFQDGVLLIAAAGNSGNSAYSYPASYDWVMSVAAVDAEENRAGFSQFNDQVEISGPGVGVMSTVPGNSYSSYSGTSMATPHVAGVAALVWSHFPECTPFQIRLALVQSAKEKENGCNDEYGWGIVQAKAAYDLLLQNGGCEGIADPNVNDGFSGGCAFSEPAPTAAPTPCPYSDNLVVDILTDNYPAETNWMLKKGSERFYSESYSSADTPHSTEVCLAPGEYTWTLNDSYGDGLCCSYGSGSYELKLNGETIAEGGEFGSSVSHTFTVA